MTIFDDELRQQILSVETTANAALSEYVISFLTYRISCSSFHLNDNPYLKISLYTCIYYFININSVIAKTLYLDIIKKTKNNSKTIFKKIRNTINLSKTL